MNGKGSRPRPMDRERWEAAPWPPVVTHHQLSRRFRAKREEYDIWTPPVPEFDSGLYARRLARAPVPRGGFE